MFCENCKRDLHTDQVQWVFDAVKSKSVPRCRKDRECFEYVETGRMARVKNHAKRFYVGGR